MKKLSVSFLSLVALTAAVTSCHNDDPASAPATTALNLTFKDPDGNLVSGAKVFLFSDADFSTVVDSVITDATGIAKFSKNLTSQVYYIDAATDKNHGCLSNIYTTTATVGSDGKTPVAIPVNQATSLAVTLKPVGSITFTNNSTTDSYNAYVARTPASGAAQYQLVGPMVPGLSGPLVVPTGSFDVKFVKLDANHKEIAGTEVVKAGNTVTACSTMTVTSLN